MREARYRLPDVITTLAVGALLALFFSDTMSMASISIPRDCLAIIDRYDAEAEVSVYPCST